MRPKPCGQRPGIQKVEIDSQDSSIEYRGGGWARGGDHENEKIEFAQQHDFSDDKACEKAIICLIISFQCEKTLLWDIQEDWEVESESRMNTVARDSGDKFALPIPP